MFHMAGTTGQPKGCLHAQRVLLGHMPGVEMSHRLFPGRRTYEIGGDGSNVSVDASGKTSELAVADNGGVGAGVGDDLFWTPADWAWIGGL
jgi:acetyl-CoA synthetase